MKVITTITLLLACTVASINVFAQNKVTEDTNNPNVKVSTTKSKVKKANIQVSDQSKQPASAKSQNNIVYKPLKNSNSEKNNKANNKPYFNYKGIQDPVEAKKAWVADHPERYDKSSQLPYYRYKGIENLDEAKRAWVKDHPEEYKKSNTPAKR